MADVEDEADDPDPVALSEVASANVVEAVVAEAVVDVPFSTDAATPPTSLASVVRRPCSCWSSVARVSLDEAVLLEPVTDVAESDVAAEPSLDGEEPVVWSCDRTERKPETADDKPLASTLDAVASELDVDVVPAAAVGSVVESVPAVVDALL